jgi:hypothetical protein
MAGSIALSLTQRYDKTTHVPLDGGLLYFYAAGTTTPQSAYQDISLTIPWPNPMTLDSGGNVPQLFFADGYVKFRLTNSSGVTQIEADYVLVLGPTAGSGAAPSVDATTIIQTGWLQPIYGTGNVTGFVRANGRTLGNAASGATERANADTVALFQFLYGQDTNLAVSGGRGASAAVDYAANKTITLPDWRGRGMAFLDDMGNSAAGRLTSTYYGTSPIVLGAASTGLERRTLVTANLPAYTPAGSVTVNSSLTDWLRGGISDNYSSVGGFGTWNSPTRATITSTGTLTGTAQGGTSTPFSIIPPEMLATLYIKL